MVIQQAPKARTYPQRHVHGTGALIYLDRVKSCINTRNHRIRAVALFKGSTAHLGRAEPRCHTLRSNCSTYSGVVLSVLSASSTFARATAPGVCDITSYTT